VTEIPEHLLKRSKDRKNELQGGGASSDAPATTPATTASATPAPAAAKPAVPAPKPPKADPPYVVAAKTRRKIPYWAMAGLAALPIWAFMYFLALKPADKVVAGPISTGIEYYSGCAGCHGANGAGGAGRALYQGESLKTFPHIEDMLNFVYTGSAKYVAAGLNVYGDPNREGGAHAPLSYNGNPMPQQGEKAGGALTEYQILGVVCHIRYDFAGADPNSEEWSAEYNMWCSPDSEIFKALQDKTTSFDTLHEDFAMMENAPRFVGTDARPSAK
jgi:mono/diheme cytochrome c family protein